LRGIRPLLAAARVRARRRTGARGLPGGLTRHRLVRGAMFPASSYS
jgi:hypothetical protein